MAWHSGKPADTDLLSQSVQHIRENFAELEPLQPYVAAIVDSRIVEMGSNSNGYYARWENGLQVCWLPRLTLPTQTSSQARDNWTFPAEFVDTNYSVHITQAWQPSDSAAIKVTMAFSQTRTTSRCMATLASKNSDLADGESWGVHLIAIGRWK